jgi:hypothetical protein
LDALVVNYAMRSVDTVKSDKAKRGKIYISTVSGRWRAGTADISSKRLL